MRRRSKPRVVWLPQTNANSIGDGSQVYQLAILNVTSATGDVGQAELPMVLDAQESAVTDAASLSDIESSGYRLRRIVGKVWVQCIQSAVELDTGSTYVVTAGFIVRRCDTATGASFAVLADATPPFPNIDPGKIDNSGDPWIWRRSWILGNNNSLSATQTFQLMPTRNFGDDYGGGIAEGPHVDQKTARIVGPEERLFLDVTATCLGESIATPALQVQFAVFTDIRVLASLRTTSGNRRNASR